MVEKGGYGKEREGWDKEVDRKGGCREGRREVDKVKLGGKGRKGKKECKEKEGNKEVEKPRRR